MPPHPSRGLKNPSTETMHHSYLKMACSADASTSSSYPPCGQGDPPRGTGTQSTDANIMDMMLTQQAVGAPQTMHGDGTLASSYEDISSDELEHEQAGGVEPTQAHVEILRHYTRDSPALGPLEAYAGQNKRHPEESADESHRPWGHKVRLIDNGEQVTPVLVNAGATMYAPSATNSRDPRGRPPGRRRELIVGEGRQPHHIPPEGPGDQVSDHSRRAPVHTHRARDQPHFMSPEQAYSSRRSSPASSVRSVSTVTSIRTASPPPRGTEEMGSPLDAIDVSRPEPLDKTTGEARPRVKALIDNIYAVPLTKEATAAIYDNYPRPRNLETLHKTRINQEILDEWELSGKTQAVPRDAPNRSLQWNMQFAARPLVQILNDIDAKPKEVDARRTAFLIGDTLKLLARASWMLNNSRREVLKPSLSGPTASLAKEVNTQGFQFLLGDNLREEVAARSKVHDTFKDMIKTVPHKSKKQDQGNSYNGHSRGRGSNNSGHSHKRPRHSSANKGRGGNHSNRHQDKKERYNDQGNSNAQGQQHHQKKQNDQHRSNAGGKQNYRK